MSNYWPHPTPNEKAHLADPSAIDIAKLVKLGYGLLPHPRFYPGLVPRDFFLIPNLKFYLRMEIGVERLCYRRHGDLLRRPLENIYFRRVKEVGK